MIAAGLALSFVGIVVVLVRPSATSVMLSGQLICTVWSLVFATLASQNQFSVQSARFLVLVSMSLFVVWTSMFTVFLFKWAGMERNRSFDDGSDAHPS